MAFFATVAAILTLPLAGVIRPNYFNQWNFASILTQYMLLPDLIYAVVVALWSWLRRWSPFQVAVFAIFFFTTRSIWDAVTLVRLDLFATLLLLPLLRILLLTMLITISLKRHNWIWVLLLALLLLSGLALLYQLQLQWLQLLLIIAVQLLVAAGNALLASSKASPPAP